MLTNATHIFYTHLYTAQDTHVHTAIASPSFVFCTFLPSTSRSIFLLQTFNNILIAPSNKPIHSTHIYSHK